MKTLNDNTLSAMIAALDWAARSVHHPVCPIARGKGQRTITRDECSCHVKAASAALELFKRERRATR